MKSKLIFMLSGLGLLILFLGYSPKAQAGFEISINASTEHSPEETYYCDHHTGFHDFYHFKVHHHHYYQRYLHRYHRHHSHHRKHVYHKRYIKPQPSHHKRDHKVARQNDHKRPRISNSHPKRPNRTQKSTRQRNRYSQNSRRR